MIQAIRDTYTNAQRDQEDALRDHVLIQRATGATTLDENTGVLTPVKVLVYSGPGSHQPVENNEHTNPRSDTPVTTMEYVLKIPVSAPIPEVGDSVSFVTTMDPLFPNGIPFRVALLMSAPYPTIRRVMIEQVIDRG